MSFCFFSAFYAIVKSIESQTYCKLGTKVKGLFIVQAFTVKINNNNNNNNNNKNNNNNNNNKNIYLFLKVTYIYSLTTYF